MPTDIDPDKMEEIKNSDETWVVDFWADWCQPCKKLAPIFEEVSEEVEDANFGKVDMEENQEIGTGMRVRALPTILIMKGDQEVARTSGVKKKDEFKAWVQENI